MSRPLRVEYPGAVYHLTARGNARQKIFRDDTGREVFLQTLGQVISRYGWLWHAYCLMDNHYHLLVETPKPNLSGGMRQLNGVYTQAFNRRHSRAGHLFQGRYKAIVVEKQAHLLELCRYVVLNPVRVRPRRPVRAWRWSSYRATAGLAPVPAFLTVDWVLGHFQEVPRAQWKPMRPSLEQVFRQRGEGAIEVAYRKHGYRMREIAEYLRVHYATVSRKLRAIEREKRKNV